MPQGSTSASGGSCVLEPTASSPIMSNRPPWLALAWVVAANSKATSIDSSSARRLRLMLSKAPPLIRASTVRLLSLLRSTRRQKSNRLLNGPLVSPRGPVPTPSRAATMASMAAWPVPLMAPRP
ncbi:hypothetical protein D3C72_1227760 [compost metagenome]